MRPGLGRKGHEDAGVRNVVLEAGASGGVHERVQAALAVVPDTVAEDEVVHAPGDIDRVDLDVVVVGEGGGDAGCWRVEQQGAAHEPAGGDRGDGERGHAQ